ncbi:MAG: hypothetical protein AAGE92_15240, partial [Cyanobacteria bacterium P01_G01_bin.4]
MLVSRPGRVVLTCLGLCLSVLIAVTFIRTALQAPRRMPLLIVADSYPQSWDANPWVAEDVELLTALDGRNVHVVDQIDSQQIAAKEWDSIADSLAHCSACTDSDSLMVYVNLHTGVDDSGEPCWIPKWGTPHDPRTWIQIWPVIERLSGSISPESDLVLFFEGGRRSHFGGTNHG